MPTISAFKQFVEIHLLLLLEINILLGLQNR